MNAIKLENILFVNIITTTKQQTEHHLSFINIALIWKPLQKKFLGLQLLNNTYLYSSIWTFKNVLNV